MTGARIFFGRFEVAKFGSFAAQELFEMNRSFVKIETVCEPSRKKNLNTNYCRPHDLALLGLVFRFSLQRDAFIHTIQFYFSWETFC